MSKILLCCAALVLLCAAGFGQAVPTAEGPKESFDFFGGYSFGHGDFGIPGRFTGADASASVGLASWFGVEAIINEINGIGTDQYKSNVRMLTGAGGPKFMHTIHRRYTPWAHVMVGGNRLEIHSIYHYDQVSIALDYGFGFDVNVTKYISIRPGEIDFVQTDTGPHGATNNYYAGGIVFHLPR